MDLTTATPVEIDTELARIYGEQMDARLDTHQAADSLRHYARVRNERHSSRRSDFRPIDEVIAAARENSPSWEQSNVEYLVTRLTDARARLARLRDEEAPLQAEYNRRPWTRAFLAITSGGGHVHKSTECSTCFLDRFDDITGEFRPGTKFAWMVNYSGHSEDEIVADAGERACTICYPSAPVETLNRPTKMFSQDEIDAAEARKQREQAKRDRLAAKIAKGLTADGSEFVVTWVDHNAGGWDRDPATRESTYVYRDRKRTESFKTERAAVQWVVQYKAWGRSSEKTPAFEQVIEAVAAKHGKSLDEVRKDIDAKVAAKIKRDNR
jgi:hypothetical protein